MHPNWMHQWRCGSDTVGFVCLRPLRDDAFSDNLSQKADSEASSGPLLADDKSSSKNGAHSPCEQSPEYNFGGMMGRYGILLLLKAQGTGST